MPLIVPILIIVLSVPLILGMVSRNGWYGFRTHYTLSSDKVWYPANRVAGIALLLAGFAWLVAVLVLPGMTDSIEQARRYAVFVGMGSLGVAFLVSFLNLGRL
jgi:uncharacterized membrane protein